MGLLQTTILAAVFTAVNAFDTVPVDLTQYVGRWYQMYADVEVYSLFERDAYCITADYAFNDEGTVSVFNSQRVGGVAGPLSNISGTATPTDEPGQFGVKFDSQPDGVPAAPYWVVMLGPVNADGLYDYSVVTDDKNVSLFVLARDPTVFATTYDAEVTSQLTAWGFDGKLTTPVASAQDGCTYPASPFKSSARTWSAKPQVPQVAHSVSECAPVSPVQGLDLAEYARATWYIQQQQLTAYQAPEDLFCVLATYDLNGSLSPGGEGYRVPGFQGPVVGVYNYATQGAVNGPAENNGTVLCAREEDPATPAMLSVAPCFLPNQLAGPYWVVAVGGAANSSSRSFDTGTAYAWAAVSGGQPTVELEDGLCTTRTDTTNGSGLWIFSRSPLMPAADLVAARQSLTDLGFSLDELLVVAQEGCDYRDAVIKN